jgi:UDP-N-acetylmuramate dehydrogenase
MNSSHDDAGSCNQQLQSNARLEGIRVVLTGKEHFREKVGHAWQGAVQWQCPLSRYTTLRVGGPAAALIEPATLAELVQLIRGLREQGIDWQVIGRGSNILVADEGLPGVVIVLASGFADIDQEAVGETCLVRATAGCRLPKLVAWCTAQGLSGLEFAAGIPGSVGGAIFMNAGAWGLEISSVLDALVVITAGGESHRLPAAAEDFGYRRWHGGKGVVIAAGIFKLQPDEPAAIVDRCNHYLQARRERQPLGVASAGSFFKNPPGQAAGRLIEEAGLKGTRIGDAIVSDRHANFLVNDGRATARDFVALMHLIRERVLNRTGILLEPEVQLLGFEEMP